MERRPIRKGDVVRFLPQWQDKGDETITHVAADDEEKGRVTVRSLIGFTIEPTQVVTVDMIDFTPTNEQIASEFCKQLREQLTADEFAEVVARNAAETDPRICHSHDFCDANQVMLDAMENLGIEWDVGFDCDTPWTMAKAKGFSL